MLFSSESAAGLDFTGGAAATSTLITFLLGLGIVFIGLIALILIIKVMGAIMRAYGKKKTKAVPPVEAEKPAAVPVPEGDMGEIKAAVAAVIATMLGESVSGIRIVSFKKVD
jgi:sodium pump decarboxylase gamma subunit